MNQYTEANRINWDERVPIHVASECYELGSFKAGCCSLKSVELEELGDVSGKTLLHLQCHFGMDTLSWARRGAIVTGVDFSTQAIKQAKALATELNIKARFICSDIYDLPQNLKGGFDIVFTSYGVLCWLGDLTRWANVIAHFLKVGGIFYIVEGHPIGNLFDDETDGHLSIRYSYFNTGPERYESEYTYTDGSTRLENTVCYEWMHSLGEIVNALIEAGLEIQFLHEFPFAFFKQLPWMSKGSDGWWRLPNENDRIPFLFSLKAKKLRISSKVMKYYYPEHIEGYQRIKAEGKTAWNEIHGSTGFENFSSRDFLESALPRLHFSVPNPTVLEYGCGTGPSACFLAERGFQVDGIDIISTAIEMAKQFAQKRNLDIHYEVQDICFLPHEGKKYDMIVDSYCLQGIVLDKDRKNVFSAIRARLKSEGYYLISTAIFDEERFSEEVQIVDGETNCIYNKYGDDILDARTSIVYIQLDENPFHYEEAIRINDVWYLPNRRHLTPPALRAEIEAEEFKVLYQDGGNLICVRRDTSSALHSASGIVGVEG